MERDVVPAHVKTRKEWSEQGKVKESKKFLLESAIKCLKLEKILFLKSTYVLP